MKPACLAEHSLSGTLVVLSSAMTTLYSPHMVTAFSVTTASDSETMPLYDPLSFLQCLVLVCRDLFLFGKLPSCLYQGTRLSINGILSGANGLLLLALVARVSHYHQQYPDQATESTNKLRQIVFKQSDSVTPVPRFSLRFRKVVARVHSRTVL